MIAPDYSIVPRWDYNRRWIEAHCRIPDGDGRGNPLVMAPFQVRFLKDLYGQGRGDAARRIVLSTAKKNGKSTLIGAIGMLHTVGPESYWIPGERIYAGALSKDQASIVYNSISGMIDLAPDYIQNACIVKDYQKVIEGFAYGLDHKVEFVTLAAEAKTVQGVKPPFALVDEMGEVDKPIFQLYENLDRGMRNRKEPIMIIISTQAEKDEDAFSILIDSSKKPNSRTILHLYACPSESTLDPFCEEALRLANPGMGTPILPTKSVIEEALEDKESPSKHATYNRFSLNRRASISDVSWLTEKPWTDICYDLSMEDYRGHQAWGGLDLSVTTDPSAFALVFNGGDHLAAFTMGWVTETSAKNLQSRSRFPVFQSAKDGEIKIVDDEYIDYNMVIDDISEVVQEYNIDLQVVGYDKYKINDLKAAANRAKFEMPLVEHPQGFGYPNKDTGLYFPGSLEKAEVAIFSKALRINKSRFLTHNVNNCRIRSQPQNPDNRCFIKKRQEEVIDYVIALVMAVGCSNIQPEQESPSVFSFSEKLNSRYQGVQA